MEKNIKMSLETARQMYKEGNETTNKWLLENFTKEELEPKKGFTWEGIVESWGKYISTTMLYPASHKHERSMEAFSKLSHIVNKYNEGKQYDKYYYSVWRVVNKSLEVKLWGSNSAPHLYFIDYKDAQTSMEVNRQLWLDYWMID